MGPWKINKRPAYVALKKIYSTLGEISAEWTRGNFGENQLEIALRRFSFDKNSAK